MPQPTKTWALGMTSDTLIICLIFLVLIGLLFWYFEHKDGQREKEITRLKQDQKRMLDDQDVIDILKKNWMEIVQERNTT